MTGLRIVFLGTGRLAEPVFAALCESPHQVVGLVTQPDRTGPGSHKHVNPLKESALARRMRVLQPDRIRNAESVAELQALQPELFVVAAYGQILSKAILDMPRLGTINVHASLLPKYRGATPIHAAVLNGDVEAGVTIIQLVPQLDAGPMLGMVRTPIGAKETTGELEARLAALSVPLTLDVIQQLAEGTAHPVEQDHAAATHVGKLTKPDGRIDWTKPAVQVERHLRGMQPWPGPFTTLVSDGKPPLRLQILDGTVIDSAGTATAGTVIEVTANSFSVRCGEGVLRIDRVHPEAKRPMSTTDFLRGRVVVVGDRLE
ncbi:MAG TPA: methionyl-tRNA formyltransferase [Planctomycetaceae bacterium]|nr:methionyl-tRNA formyltransferase [Planctomycetaceae bacterium]